MLVTKDSPQQVQNKGESFYFFSIKCLETFKRDPEKFTVQRSSDEKDHEQVAPGTIYTCPMHPEIRQDHPGSCPKCGMALEPLMPSLDDDNPELKDFSRRFWWTLPFTVFVTVLAMFGRSEARRDGKTCVITGRSRG